MTLLGLLSETAVVVRSAAVIDEYGDTVAGNETRITYERARFEQLATDEIVRGQDSILADWRVFLPADADVTPYDNIEGRGHSFKVHGLPDLQRTPRGPHHLVVQLRFVA